MRSFENVNTVISLWFAYPGYNAAHAPAFYAGVKLAPGQELDPVVLGYPSNLVMINPAVGVIAVASVIRMGSLRRVITKMPI